MASVGHIAVGMAAARVARRQGQSRWSLAASMVFWSALSLLPDADVIGFGFGIRYADEWGHRGASHSFAFAVIVSLLVGLCARPFGLEVRRTALTALVVVASHPVLDTLTNGGLGCALWWPFSNARVFAPWNPIPVAPIGRGFFSARGLSVALTELLLFAPLLAFAVWPRKRSRRTPA